MREQNQRLNGYKGKHHHIHAKAAPTLCPAAMLTSKPSLIAGFL